MDADPGIAVFLKLKGKKHLEEDSGCVIPGYRIQEEQYGTGFPPEMVISNPMLTLPSIILSAWK
jgi:hypothetical protein